MVDEGTTMGDLKGLLDQFAKAMYGADKRTRFRPGYYPFTEPSVAFDVEWHSEFVEHNVTGLLVRDRDVPHLAEAVIAILDDPGRARTLAANAERKLREESDQAVLVKEEIREYAEVISSASARTQ